MQRLAVMTESGKGEKEQKEWSSLPREKGQRLSLGFGRMDGRCSRAARHISFESRRFLVLTFLVPKMPILVRKTAIFGTLIQIFQHDSLARPR